MFTGFTEHTVAKGESFYTIGKKYNVGYKSIAEANPTISPTRLRIGDKIKIPPPKTPSASLNGPSGGAGGADGEKTYKVRSGDNLGKIARNYGVTVKELRTANHLRTDQIKVGQILKIPAKAPPTPLETVPPVPAVPPATPPPGFPPPSQ
jgi:membrane-bound lytic murein transglycosylase D